MNRRKRVKISDGIFIIRRDFFFLRFSRERMFLGVTQRSSIEFPTRMEDEIWGNEKNRGNGFSKNKKRRLIFLSPVWLTLRLHGRGRILFRLFRGVKKENSNEKRIRWCLVSWFRRKTGYVPAPLLFPKIIRNLCTSRVIYAAKNFLLLFLPSGKKF